MGDQVQFSPFTSAPAAAKLSMKLYEVNWALILVGPSGILDLLELGIHQHQASGPDERMHSHVIHSNIAIEVS